MGTVSDIPFTLCFITECGTERIEQFCSSFMPTIEEAMKCDNASIVIEEYDPVSVRFQCLGGARLYLEALDIIPTEYGCIIDEEGNIYRNSSDEEFPLYKNENTFDALRVDNFLIRILHDGNSSFATLQVKPKQLNDKEWRIMVSDIEDVASGLAQDIVRKNIGLGTNSSLAIPPIKLRQFLIFKEYSSRLLPCLLDIAENPRHAIVTNYVRIDKSRYYPMDATAIRQQLMKAEHLRYVFAPVKEVNYNTSENRLLKRLLKYCIEIMQEFHDTVVELLSYSTDNIRNSQLGNEQYRLMYIASLRQFEIASRQLLCNAKILNSKEWFKQVSDSTDGRMTNAFALDFRYNCVSIVYKALQNKDFFIKLDPLYSFSWKKSSQMYEIWCYLSVCNSLQQKYTIQTASLITSSDSNLLFPLIKSGHQVEMISDDTMLLISYDRKIPHNERDCSIRTDPYYCDSYHDRPDIRIDIIYTPHNVYIGSIVIECKYRRIRNFYGNGTYNSKEQIESYYENANSNLYFNLPAIHDVRPVKIVFVVTPDDSVMPRNRKNGHIRIKTLRPGYVENTEDLLKVILATIENQRVEAQKID